MKNIFLWLLAGGLVIFGCGEKKTQELTYPETRKGEISDTIFGNVVQDPYRWLEDDYADETEQWVKAQNEVTQAYLSDIPFRSEIRSRMEELYNYEKISAPRKEGDYFYFSKNDGLQNQSVIYRKKSLEDSAEVFIDPNEFSEDGTVALAGLSFTEDGKLVALSIQESGSDWRKVVFMDAINKTYLEDTLVDVKFSGISWYKNDGVYYSSYDKPKEGSELSGLTQYHKVYFHNLGGDQSSDELIFGGEETPRRYIWANVTQDNKYLVLSASVSTTGNELYIKNLEADGPIEVVVNNFDNDHTVLYSEDDKFFVLTNLEAPNKKIVSFNADKYGIGNWKTLIPEAEQVMEGVSFAGRNIFINYLKDAYSKVLQYDLEGNLIRQVVLPGIGTASGFNGKREDEKVFYYFYSFTYPSTIFYYDIASGDSDVFARPEVKFNADEYETKQVFYKSKDGTEIPMFIVHKKGIALNGSHPTMLYGYGGFSISLTPAFSFRWVSWLDMGGIFALANLRGGGEYGEEWHQAGTKLNKQNVFDDFIAAAEYLQNEGYTSSSKLTIHGGSNGGLLVGAVMTQRPDLMEVALPAVGVLDMLRYHKFTAGAGWIYDYGCADSSKVMCDYLLSYSPVHNVKETEYPATLVTTGDHDDRVVPAHSFKFAATLQEKNQSNDPVLIRIETDAGHGSGKPTTKILDELADMYAFAFFNLDEKPYQ
ncbi:MAG TPA: S9 family peptidase [Cytophagales bacterium]|jgi:prolyl oligopeptidase|nr:S9 family peptidase [Cytophagales bacterium]